MCEIRASLCARCSLCAGVRIIKRVQRDSVGLDCAVAASCSCWFPCTHRKRMEEKKERNGTGHGVRRRFPRRTWLHKTTHHHVHAKHHQTSASSLPNTTSTPGMMQIYVKMIKPETLTLKVQSSTTVDEIKDMIQKREGICLSHLHAWLV